MANGLQDVRVAVLATNGFEQSELFEPVKALRNAGAKVEIVSLQGGEIRGWSETDWGESVAVDKTLDEVSSDDYEGLVLPGGQINPDLLRNDDRAVEFVRGFHDEQKPIGAICHAPWLLIEAEVVAGRDMTSYPSISTDLRNAGANWIDAEVVVDEGIVTSRSPKDLKAFCSKLIEELEEGPHLRRGRPGRPLLRRPIRPDSDYSGAEHDTEGERGS